MLDCRYSRAAIGAFAACLVAGCGAKPNPLIGKWQLTQNLMGQPITVTREFRADGSEIMTGPIKGAADSQMTYTVNGNTITERVVSMTINGMMVRTSQPPPGGPTGVQETYVISGDTLALTNNATGTTVTQTFTRVKQ